MKCRTLSVLAGVGLMAGTAFAGGNATYTPLNGTFGSPFNNGVIHGFGFTPTGGGGGGSAGLGNLYDNILTINGGAATAGFFGPFDDIPGTQAFVDWAGSEVQWGDDLHEVGDHPGQGDDVVTQLVYGYSNSVATTTHIIKMYQMVPPSIVPSSTSLVDKGPLLGSIVVPANPTGAFMVTVTGFSFLTRQSAIWIKFVEVGPGFPGTFWLSGGAGNGVGLTHPGVAYSDKYPGGIYNFFFPFPSFYFDGTGYVASNIQVALSGFHIPGPAVISLLGLGGLVALRRRRVR